MSDQPPFRNRRLSDLSQLRQRIAEREQLNSSQEGPRKHLKHSLSLLRATIESTSDGLLVVDTRGSVVSYNRRFLKMWNIPLSVAEQMDDRKLIDAVLDQLQDPEEFLKKIRHLYGHPGEESFDTLEFKDGRVFERCSLPQKIGEDIVGRVWSFHDATEHIRTEKALQQSTAEFEAFFNALSDAAIFVDTHRHAVRINPAFTRLFGYSIDELQGKTTQMLYAREEDYREMGINRYNGDAVQQLPAVEITYRRKDGTVFDAETMGSQIRDAQGNVVGYFCIHRDITGRKLAEKQLLAEKRLSDVTINTLPGIFCLVDDQGRFLRWNRNLEEVTQYSAEQISGMHPADFFQCNDKDRIEQNMRNVFESGRAVVEAGLASRDGHSTPYFFTGVRIMIDDRPGIIAMGIDISDRKRVEEELLRTHEELEERVRERTASLVKMKEDLEAEIAEKNRAAASMLQMKELLINVIDTMPVGVVILEKDGSVHRANPAMKEIWKGFKQVALHEYGEYKAWHLASGKKIEPEQWAAARAITRGESTLSEELEIECFDGSRKIVLHSGVPVRDAQQQITGAIVVMEDITKAKETEKSIIVSNTLLRLFTEMYSRKEYLDAVVKLLTTLSGCRCIALRSWDSRGDTLYDEFVGFTREFWAHENCFSLNNRRCTCIRAAMKQPALQGPALVTMNGSFWCNDLSAFVAALAEDDKKGCQWDCLQHGFASLGIIPIRRRRSLIGVIYLADERKGHLPDKVLNLIESLIPLIGEALYRFSVEEESRVMQDQLRNLTAHLQEVREKERTTIAREIHDDLGQILTALKMNLSWVGSQYADHEQLAIKTKGMVSLVDATIQRVKRITTELRPGILDHLGVTAAIEWQASEFKKLTGICCDVDIPDEIILPRHQSTQIFRIFEETLTNIIRHAEATQVNVRFTDKGDTVELAVKDNGKGITEAQLQSPGSFGLIGIRERILSLGGEIIISGSLGNGTEVTIEVPKNKSEPSAEGAEM